MDESTRTKLLTLFESIPPADLDFYLRLQEQLAARGLPCPRPQRDAARDNHRQAIAEDMQRCAQAVFGLVGEYVGPVGVDHHVL